jgi:PKD repeat protein
VTCNFTNTSADPDGSFTSSWNFGDGSPADTTTNPTHTYAATVTTPYTVVLTVTDNGGLGATSSQTVTVTPGTPAPPPPPPPPPPSGTVTLTCVNNTGAADSTADCGMDIGQKAIITVTVKSTMCKFNGNTFIMPSPAAGPADTLFRDGCKHALLPEGTAFTINGPNPDHSFPAGSHLNGEFVQGHPRPGDPPKGPPATRVTGSFPDWTVAIDDGGNVGGVGEPNFTDIILTIHAAVVP